MWNSSNHCFVVILLQDSCMSQISALENQLPHLKLIYYCNIRPKWNLTSNVGKSWLKLFCHCHVFQFFFKSMAFPLWRVTLTSVMKCLDPFLHAKVSCWLSTPIRYKTKFLTPGFLSDLWSNLNTVSEGVIIIVLSCEGGSSSDGGQLLSGFWGSAGNHPCHQQGTLRLSCF